MVLQCITSSFNVIKCMTCLLHSINVSMDQWLLPMLWLYQSDQSTCDWMLWSIPLLWLNHWYFPVLWLDDVITSSFTKCDHFQFCDWINVSLPVMWLVDVISPHYVCMMWSLPWLDDVIFFSSVIQDVINVVLWLDDVVLWLDDVLQFCDWMMWSIVVIGGCDHLVLWGYLLSTKFSDTLFTYFYQFWICRCLNMMINDPIYNNLNFAYHQL